MAGEIDETAIVLVTLVPILVLSLGFAGYFWWLYHKKCLMKDQDATGQQLADLQRHVDSNAQRLRQLSLALQTDLAPANRYRSDSNTTDANSDHHQIWSMTKHEQPASTCALPTLPPSTCLLPLSVTPTPVPGPRVAPKVPRPLSYNISPTVPAPDHRDGSLPRAAPNLERLRTSRTDTTNSAESFAHLRYGAIPSDITEEETTYGQSPFDTPKKLEPVKEDHLEESNRLPSMSFPFSSETYNKLLQLPSATTMKSNPTHPDLVPAPLNLAKRHSTKEQCSSTRQLPDISDGIDRGLLRRSLTGPPTPKKDLKGTDEAVYGSGGAAATMANAISGLSTPPIDDVKAPDITLDNTKPVAAMVQTPRRRSQIPLPKKTFTDRPASMHMRARTETPGAEPNTMTEKLTLDSCQTVPKPSLDSSTKRIVRLSCTTPDKKKGTHPLDKKPSIFHNNKHPAATTKPVEQSTTASSSLFSESPSNPSNLFTKDTIKSTPSSPKSQSNIGEAQAKSLGTIFQRQSHIISRECSQVLPMPLALTIRAVIPERGSPRDTANIHANDIQNPFHQDIDTDDKENRPPLTPPHRASARANPFRDINNRGNAQVGLNDEGDEESRGYTTFGCEDTKILRPITPASMNLRLS